MESTEPCTLIVNELMIKNENVADPQVPLLRYVAWGGGLHQCWLLGHPQVGDDDEMRTRWEKDENDDDNDRKKFSARHFWSDCVKYEATTAQYIGEICR